MDPAPFEPHMPEAVRAVIAEARAKRGPVAPWLAAATKDERKQVWFADDLVIHHPKLADAITGWLVGMSTFIDPHNLLARRLRNDDTGRLAPIVLTAFAAGLRAGVPTLARQWQGIEKIVGLSSVFPDALRDALSFGLIAPHATARSVALRLARAHAGGAAILRARASATGPARKRLDAAVASLGLDAPPTPAARDDLLGRLLAAHAATFDPALAAPIARAGAAAARTRPPLRASSKAELEAAWLALAARRDPADVDTLLATPWPGAWKLALARVEALHALPPDPRLAADLPRIRAGYSSKGSRPFHRAAEALATRSLGTPHGAAPPTLLAEAGGSAAPPPRALDALWADLHARPGDLALRAVLADALQAAGDPRGEYIALGLAIGANGGTPAARTRAAALVAAHGDAWLGRIRGAAREGRVYANGFLSALELKTAEGLAACAGDPAWRTVEALAVRRRMTERVTSATLAELLANAPSLRTLIVDSGLLETGAIAALEGPFPSLRALGLKSQADLSEVKRGVFPALATIGIAGPIYGHDLAEPFAAMTALGAQAAVLFSHIELAEALAAYARERTLPELRLVHAGHYNLTPSGWAVRVRRADRRALLSWGGGRYVDGTLTTQVAALRAARKTAIEVWLPKRDPAAVDEARTLGVVLAGAPLDVW